MFTTTPIRTFVVATLLGLSAGCGGDTPSARSPTSDAVSTTPASVGSAEDPVVAEPSSTDPAVTQPVDTEPVDTEPVETSPATTPEPVAAWSTTAAAEFESVLAAVSGNGMAGDVLDTLFANPIPVTLPADAALSEVWVRASVTDDGYDVWWNLAVATAADTAGIEADVISGFSDPRFDVGARVESTLDSGVFVTLNYPASDLGVEGGWATMALTVGPETDFSTPTGRNQIEISAERSIVGDDPELPAFLSGWLDEMPIAEGTRLVSIEGSLVTVSSTGVWLSALYEAEPGAFEEVVRFYSEDHSAGSLSLDSTPAPDDFSTLDRFNAGFFPTLAGYTLFVIIERDLADPESAVTVSMEVRLEAG